MGVDYNATICGPQCTVSSIPHEIVPLHESLDKGSMETMGLYIVLKSHNELDAIVATRMNLLLGFLVLFIPFGILINVIIFRYLNHYNTFMQLLFDFYENKISVDAFTRTVKTMVADRTSSEVKKISALFLKIVQKMSDSQEYFVHLSQTDVLTTIANRRKLDDVLEVKVKEATRGLLLSIILIDIDRFKKINDTYGHDTGDTILQQFALILKNSVRQIDSVGRWGGKEFLLILPTTSNEGALCLANTIREKIESFTFTLDIHVTASLGIATYHANDTERSLIKRADDALYRAKHLGRNRSENETV
jgi:diguanylate cyclase (GGDEF)-like protein